MKNPMHLAFAALVVASLAAPALAEIIGSGTCGANVTWSFDDEDHKLVIQGSGPMDDFDYSDESKWGGCLRETDYTSTIEICEGVTSVGAYAFYSCGNVEEVILPDSLASIGDYAFNSCSSLPSITIPKGVGSIGERAFFDCGDLQQIDVSPKNTAYESHEGVLYTKNLEKLVQCPAAKSGAYSMPYSTKTIGEEGFCLCKLSSITLSGSLETIGMYAFEFCTNLVSIDIPASVKSIGYSFCYGCNSLQSVNVDPGNQNYMSVDGVLFDKDMTTLIAYPTARSGGYIIPDGVQTIADWVFARSNITEVTIPGSVETVTENSFAYCKRLTAVTICDGTATIGEQAFYDCEALKTVIIPDTVTSVGQYAFFDCTNLNRVVIPYSVDFIGNDAFSLQFCDVNGKKLSTEAADLHGYIYDRNTNYYLQASPPKVCTVSFVDTGGNPLAASMDTGDDGKLSELPEVD